MGTLTEFYHDIDIFGKETRPGIAAEYTNADAIANALTLFLTIKKGEYLYNPSEGGVIDSTIFKSLSDSTVQRLSFRLKTAINNQFSELVEIIQINLTPDYSNRLMQYDITYKDYETFTINTVTLYTNTSYQNQKFEYTEIEYIEDNLLRFVILQKTSDSSQKLLYNSDDGYWYLGKFKLVNLTQEDSYFSQILAAANT